MRRRCVNAARSVALVVAHLFSVTAQVSRWVTCEDFRFSMRTTTIDPPTLLTFLSSPSALECVNGCTSPPAQFGLTSDRNAYLTRDSAGQYCYCTSSLPPENVSVSDFRLCNFICPSETIAPCGNTRIANMMGVWYELANFTGATISINLCYNITTLTELQACRTDRRAIALFMGRSSNGTYDEVNFTDPCGTNNGGCDLLLADCIFTARNGNRRCTCFAGYQPNTTADLVPGIHCIDVDECASSNNNNCDTRIALCVNTVGSFRCECRTGYIDRSTGNETGQTCVPVFNECYFGTPPVCHILASCTNNNSPPGHTCNCPSGYAGDGLAEGSGCMDINECEPSNPCRIPEREQCINTNGSFRCICRPGFILTSSVCEIPRKVQECGSNEPASLNRRVAYGKDCNVVVLFQCEDTALQAEPNRTRIVVESFRPYVNCEDDNFVNTFNASQLAAYDNEFINNGGEGVLHAQVECNVNTFSIRFSSAPVNAVGFNLNNLFLGGAGDFDTVEAMYKNNSDCQGQVWVQNGFQYRFQTVISNATSSNPCGTRHFESSTQIMYAGVVRGKIGQAGPIISNVRVFNVTFLCVVDKVESIAQSQQPYLVFDLNRKKREFHSVKQLQIGGNQKALTMNLWNDSSFRNIYEPTKTVQAFQLIYVKIDIDSLGVEHDLVVRPLRCWQSLSTNGTGYRYKNIVSNGCNQNQWKMNGNIRIISDEDDSFRFGFPVSSFDGGKENIYVSCLVDISQESFVRRCGNLLIGGSSFRADALMTVITSGPVQVLDVCGGKNRGGCEHYCTVKDRQTAVCHCATGFTIDTHDPRRCVLSSGKPPPHSSKINWYYYGAPLVVLVVLIVVSGWMYYLHKRNSSRRGIHEPKFVERQEIIVD